MSSLNKSVHKPRILLVEDDPIVQRVHSMMLEKLGYHFDVAGNGPDTLALCNENDYGLILMDLGLPDVSGIKIAAEIRRHRQKENYTPIVALTADVTSDTKTLCLAAGFSEVVTKPIPLKMLKQLLQRFS